VCQQCGSIRDVTDDAHSTASAANSGGSPASIPAREANATQLAGFTVQRVERIYRGLCAACTQTVEAAGH
jgi:hypothetical protein